MKQQQWSVVGAAAAALAVLVACQDAPLQPAGAGVGGAPSFASSGKAPAAAAAAARRLIADEYIVVFDSTVADAPGLARKLAAQEGAQLRHSYARAIKGFSARMSAPAAARLARLPGVAYVEQDEVVSAAATQSGATWGLDRVDQRTLPLSGTFTYTPTGAGVTIYILDTGIRFDHQEFGGRAAFGFDAVGDGRNGADCNGHGTHVAGTAGGTVYGVAKGARLVAVRVLGCDGNGTLSGVIAGVDWVAANAAKPAVANLSLGGGASQALDDAVRRAIASGITFAVAAGNDNVDACYASPARVAEAVTVGATTSSDARASYSNYGACLDLFAPGSNITSAWYTGATAAATSSGTSMATPHVAGAAALYLQGSPAALPSAVASAILGSATLNAVTGVAGSPNRLLYSPLTTAGADVGTPAPPPTTAPCTGCTAYSGSLSGPGAAQTQPNGTYYHSAVSGAHKGWLRAGTGTDFDLYLYKWNAYWGQWLVVARAETSTSSEQISYSGTAGYYLWEVRSYAGSGAYQFWLTKP